MSSEASYHRRLLVFLSVASFFEGYDFLALSQLLPAIQKEFGLTPTGEGVMVGVVNFGTMLAYALVRTADKLGRKKVLSITIAGYTISSFLSGLAPNVYVFALLQLCARIFLIGEWAVAMVIAAEEFPAERRGSSMGIIQAAATLGSIACAGLVPTLTKLPWGWRSVYFVGAIPLLLLAVARRGMRETKRFETQQAEAGDKKRDPFAILKGPHARRVLLVAVVWAFTYVCTQNAVTFWKRFAIAERGLTEDDCALSVTIAACASVPMVFLSGKLMDRIGRRRSSIIIFLATSLGTLGAYVLPNQTLLTVALVIAIFGTTAPLQVLNAYTAELFPTDQRADAFAWCNNLLGRIGYVLSPAEVGVIAGQTSWSTAVALTTIFPLFALAIILARFPETSGKELEQTAAA